MNQINATVHDSTKSQLNIHLLASIFVWRLSMRYVRGIIGYLLLQFPVKGQERRLSQEIEGFIVELTTTD